MFVAAWRLHGPHLSFSVATLGNLCIVEGNDEGEGISSRRRGSTSVSLEQTASTWIDTCLRVNTSDDACTATLRPLRDALQWGVLNPLLQPQRLPLPLWGAVLAFLPIEDRRAVAAVNSRMQKASQEVS